MFNKNLLKEKSRIIFGNIVIYENREIGAISFSDVYLGGCLNSKELLAVKLIKSDNRKQYEANIEEKYHLISLMNNGNFPKLIDWDFDGQYI